MVTQWEQRLFDEKLDRAMEDLPEAFAAHIAGVPVIVEDEPEGELLQELGMEPGEDLCGLYTGAALTERSVEAPPDLPEQVMLFRGPIIRLARQAVPGTGREAVAELERQIRITLLHEIGHHFGLDEEDLDRLGYA